VQWLGDVRGGGCPGGEIRRGRPRVHAVSGKGGSMARDGTCVHNRAPAGTHARTRPGPWPGAPTPHLHCLWSSPLRGFAPSYLHHATGLPCAHPSSLVTNASITHTHKKKSSHSSTAHLVHDLRHVSAHHGLRRRRQQHRLHPKVCRPPQLCTQRCRAVRGLLRVRAVWVDPVADRAHHLHSRNCGGGRGREW